MWIVIKYKNNSLDLLKSEISNRLKNTKFYLPKIKLVKSYLGLKKKIEKEHKILGDYLLCYNPCFANLNLLKQISNIKGLKYFLNGFSHNQKDIEDFIFRAF